MTTEAAARYYPEIAAGGYSRVDGTVAFYQRVQALLSQQSEPALVVDFGAGRGVAATDRIPFRRSLQDLRGPGRSVVGLDVDPAAHTNPLLNDAILVGTDGRFPLPDASVDLVVSRFTFEHIDNQARVAAELGRVLKPQGWICATTPNKWGYIAVAARLVPNRLHIGVLRRLQPQKAEEDTFPTRYKMNTRADLERLFPEPEFSVYAFTFDSEPMLYAGGSRTIGRIIYALRLLPPPLRSLWQIFIQRNS